MNETAGTAMDMAWEETTEVTAAETVEQEAAAAGTPTVDEDGWPLALTEDGGETPRPLTDEDGWPLTPLTETAAEQPREPEGLKITYMGEEKELSRQEAVTLAQKGMNYDRMLRRQEEAQAGLRRAKERLTRLEDILKGRGESADELLDRQAAEEMADQTGQSVEACYRQLESRRMLDGFGALLRETRQRQREKDMEEFRTAYPDVSGRDVPEAVWQAVERGESLTGAYRGYELQRLREENARLRQAESRREQERKNRSSGMKSQRSAGESKGWDPFDALWYNGE